MPQTKQQTTGKSAIDWPAIRKEFEETNKSVKELARWFSLSDTAINKRKKKENWQRRSAESLPRKPGSAVMVATIIPEAASDVGSIIGRGRNLIVRLMNELDASTTHIGELEEMIEIQTADDKDPRRRNALMKAIDMPVRAAAVKNLANALKTLTETPISGGAGAGKKAAAAEAAANAGADNEWGDDLDGDPVMN